MPARSRLLLGGAATALLLLLIAGCGGGGSADPAAPTPAPPPPTIESFVASSAAPHVGERLQLTARFSGGSARIDPDIGPVNSGVPVTLPALDRARRYTLSVEAPGQAVQRRELELSPRFRNRYTELASAMPVQYHAAVGLADGGALIIGGSRGESTLSDAIDRFDPDSGGFTRIGQLRTGRSGHTATALPDGRVLVLGGQSSLQIGNVADLIDPSTGAVSHAGQLVKPRNRHAALALADGRVLIVGGLNRDTVELWDPQTRQFRQPAARMSHVREYPTATLLADGRVLIVGGHHIAANNVFAEIFDPRDESFTPLVSDLAERRLMHEAHLLGNGQVLVLGGELLDEQLGIVPLSSVLQIDPASGAVKSLPALEQARTLVRGVRLPDDEVLLFGGETEGRQVSAAALAYRHAGRAIAAMPLARAWHTVTRLSDGRILIVGGDDQDGQAVARAYLYD